MFYTVALDHFILGGDNSLPTSEAILIKLRSTFQISDFRVSEYIGPVNTDNMNSDALDFKDIQMGSPTFSIRLENGLFKSVQLDSRMPVFQRNVMKAWLANFQMNAAKLADGAKAFKSKEVTHKGHFPRLQHQVLKTVT